MATTTRIDRAGNSHILTISLSGEVRRRSTIWEIAISRYTNKMTAPEKLSRNKNTVSGETAAAITHRKPLMLEVWMAGRGTPLLLTVISPIGASRRAARTNSNREAVYRPEFKQDSTAVSTTAFMIWSAYGMPICLKAATYGDAPSSVSFHGRMQVSRKTDPTKNVRTRRITDWVARAIAFSGSWDSAAATVAISAPTMEKTTTTMLEKIAPKPCGRKPP